MASSTSAESESQERHGLFVLHPGPDELYDASNYLVEYVAVSLTSQVCTASDTSLVLSGSMVLEATRSKHGEKRKVGICGCETLYQPIFLNRES